MSTRPGDWLGVPAGVPDLMRHLAAFRWLLVALLVAAAALLAFRRLRAAAGTALVFALAAVLFWILYLGRPYGLLFDAGTTRRGRSLRWWRSCLLYTSDAADE